MVISYDVLISVLAEPVDDIIYFDLFIVCLFSDICYCLWYDSHAKPWLTVSLMCK